MYPHGCVPRDQFFCSESLNVISSTENGHFRLQLSFGQSNDGMNLKLTKSFNINYHSYSWQTQITGEGITLSALITPKHFTCLGKVFKF